VLFALGADPHTNHHISEAIRQASEKVGRVRTNDTKRLADYMSEAAEAETMNGRFALTVEHIVPISFITEQVYKLRRPSKSQIGSVILKWSILALITRREHETLRRAKLYDKMPDNWDRRNKFARYNEVGISLKKNRYADLLLDTHRASRQRLPAAVRIADSISTKAVSFSSARTTKRFPSLR
jgi:hypothetical protein